MESKGMALSNCPLKNKNPRVPVWEKQECYHGSKLHSKQNIPFPKAHDLYVKYIYIYV